MAEETYNVEDPRDLPYRFTYSPVTGEVFIIGIGHGFQVMGYFPNRPAFHRFLIEGNKTDSMIADPIPDNVKDIFPDRHTGGENETKRCNGE